MIFWIIESIKLSYFLNDHLWSMCTCFYLSCFRLFDKVKERKYTLKESKVSMPTTLAKSLRGCRLHSSKYFFIPSVVETWMTALLNLSTKARTYSSFPCMMASRNASDLGWHMEVVKCLEKVLPSCLHNVIDSSRWLLYQVIAPFPNVVQNNFHLIAPHTPQ